jgi:hypothetical protein
MKVKMKKLSLLLPFALLLQVQSMTFLSTNTYTVAKGETIADEQWIYTVDGTVNGTTQSELFLLAGNRLKLGGQFNQSVWGLGGEVFLTGTAKQSVRLSGKTIQAAGQIDGNFMALGDTIHVATNSIIKGDIKLLGNSIILEGTTQGDVSITASRIATISGTINGNLTVIAPEIILQGNTQIGGNLTYTSGKELVPAEGIVTGKLHRALPPAAPSFSTKHLLSRLMWFLAALMVGIPFITLFPMTTAMASQLVHASPWRCLWVGALCAILLPILGTMSIFSFLGIPLGLLILSAWGFLVYTSRIVIGLVVGTLILRRNTPTPGGVLLSMTIGLATIYLITAIPAIAWSVQTVVVSMGMGALLLSLFQKRRLIIQVPEELKKLEKLKEKQNQPEE